MTATAPCLEVAVYAVSSPKASIVLQRQAHSNLATLFGYMDSLALRGLEQPTLVADLVLWDSKQTAKAAAEDIQKDDRFTQFLSNIESIQHFAHYSGASSQALNALAESPVIELSTYELSAGSAVALWHQFHQALHNIEDASSPVVGTRVDQPRSLLDLVGWSSEFALNMASTQLLEQFPELQTFFSEIGQREVFELFEVVQ